MRAGGRVALVFERDLLRSGAARVASSWRPGAGGSVGPLRHRRGLDELPLPSSEWQRITPRLAGICGSDLAAVDGRSSRWFEPIVSMPFVPGHEVVADHDGRRVVVEPVLGCVARGISPPCPACADGRLGNCERLAHGCVEPGLQTGFCESTGGGWSTDMLAHPSQLHDVPDDLDDRAAVMVEPTACALHGALAARVGPHESCAVIGAGTMGLAAVAALARWSPPAQLVVAAKHSHQQAVSGDLAGAVPTVAVAPGELARAARRAASPHGAATMMLGTGDTLRLTGGVDVTIDCVGSADSLAAALAVTRPRGRVVLVGMPGVVTLDLTPLWQREISVTGAYAYGTELLGDRPAHPGNRAAVIDGTAVRTFELAMELVAAADLGRLVSAVYPLDRASDAIAHAAEAGRRGATKVAFDCRSVT